MPIRKIKSVDETLRGYVDAALWSSNDESTPQGGEPFDKNYSRDDVAPSTLRSMRRDVVKFLRANRKAVEAYVRMREYDWSQGTVYDYLGHDLWLTRNGHGCGFWDRDYGGEKWIGEVLTDAAHKLGESNLYLGDDGQIYAMPE